MMRVKRVSRAFVIAVLALPAMACTPLKTDTAPPDASVDLDATSPSDGGAPPNSALTFSGGQFAAAIGGANLQMRDVTIELWATFSPITASIEVLVARPYGQATDDSFAVWRQGTTLHAGINPSGPEDALGFDAPSIAGRWVHVALTFDHLTGDEHLLIDGVVQSSINRPTSVAYDGSNVLIGVDSDYGTPGGYFVGTIDEIRVWSIARTPLEIMATMHTPLVGSEVGLEAYWPLDEGTGQIANDATGHGHALQLGAADVQGLDDPLWSPSTAPLSAATAGDL